MRFAEVTAFVIFCIPCGELYNNLHFKSESKTKYPGAVVDCLIGAAAACTAAVDVSHPQRIRESPL